MTMRHRSPATTHASCPGVGPARWQTTERVQRLPAAVRREGRRGV